MDMIEREMSRPHDENGSISVESTTEYDVPLIERYDLESLGVEVSSYSRCSTLKNQSMLRIFKDEDKFSIKFFQYDENVNGFVEKKCMFVPNVVRLLPGFVYYQDREVCER